MSMFKQKLSFRTQLALAELIVEVKEAVEHRSDHVRWTGEFMLSYNDNRRYPRLIIAVEERADRYADPEVLWWTNDPEQGLTFDQDVTVLLRG